MSEILASRAALQFSLFLVVAAVLFISALDLSNPDRGPHDQNWERIQATNTLIVGIDPSLPPFGQYAEPLPIGLDPDIASEIAQRLDVEVHFVLLNFDGLYDSLLLGYVDMVIAALRPDPMRADRVSFSSSYFDAGQVLVSREGFQTLEDLAGKTLGVELASEGDLAARRVENLNLERYLTANEALQAANNNEVDVALVDRVSALIFASQHEEINLASETWIPDPYVIAVRRADWRLFRAVENALSAMKADGTLDRLIKAWLVPAQP